ncbi:MAG: hypothetical protein Q9159_006161 [Coniocarpon cinnabarinum]
MTDLESLRSQYITLYRTTLPSLAKARDPAQPKWSVYLDHCFARIILDNAIGKDRPWNEVLKAPATKSMSEEQLETAIELGEAIQKGDKNLMELDERSLELRGKTKAGVKRKEEEDTHSSPKRAKTSDKDVERPKEQTREEKDSKGSDAELESDKDGKNTTETPAGIIDQAALRAQINSHRSLTPFRRRTLILLTQVPRGRYTTYQALANGIAKTSPNITGGKKSSARAVGSAMRNNPFAPQVPCHRCLASDGRLGGFGGVWDDESENAKKKRRMLRAEGLRFDGKGKVVGSPFTGFK